MYISCFYYFQPFLLRGRWTNAPILSTATSPSPRPCTPPAFYPLQSLSSSVQCCFCLPFVLLPLMCPSNIRVQRFWALMTWLKHWSLSLSYGCDELPLFLSSIGPTHLFCGSSSLADALCLFVECRLKRHQFINTDNFQCPGFSHTVPPTTLSLQELHHNTFVQSAQSWTTQNIGVLVLLAFYSGFGAPVQITDSFKRARTMHTLWLNCKWQLRLGTRDIVTS